MPDYEAPISGCLTVRVDGDLKAAFNVAQGADIEVDIETQEDGE